VGWVFACLALLGLGFAAGFIAASIMTVKTFTTVPFSEVQWYWEM
jgi:hypothetical protein